MSSANQKKKKKSPHILEHLGSLMCSQQPTACLNQRQINPEHARPFYVFMMHFNIILPPMPRSSKWSLPFQLPNQNPACYYFYRY